MERKKHIYNMTTYLENLRLKYPIKNKTDNNLDC